jgi:hypothetical protein
VFFLLALSLQLLQWIQNKDAEATVIIIGYIMAAFLNPVVNLAYLVLFLTRRGALSAVPRWLVMLNIVFLLLQIIYLIFLNGR